MVWCMQHLSCVDLELNKVSHMSSFYAGAVWRYVKQSRCGLTCRPSLTALNLKIFHLYPERVGEVGGGGVGGYSWEFFVGVCRPVLQILTLFQNKKYVILQTRFQNRPPKSIPVFRPVLWAPELAFRQKLCHHYLDSVCKQKNSSSAFWIRIFLLLSYSFGIETINMFIHSRSTLENHTPFQTKMGKVYTCFQAKTRPRWGAHTYIACIRGSPLDLYGLQGSLNGT